MLPSGLQKGPFEALQFTDKTFTPLWTCPDLDDPANEEELLKWCNKSVEACEEYYGYYFQLQQDNLMLFRGIHWLMQDRTANQWPVNQSILQRRAPRVVINHLYDFVEQWVSKLTRYRPAVAIRPATSGIDDADNAKIASDVLDYMWYFNSIDRYLQEFVRQFKIFGEAYLWILWDETKGDLHPDWVQAQQEGRKIPIIDPETGQPILSEQGEPLYIEKATRIGDVKYEVTPPWHVMDMPCRSRDQIDWSIKWETEDVEYLKAKYPEKAGKIKSGDGFDVFSNYTVNISKLKNETVVYKLFHRSTEFLDRGRYIVFTKDVILKNVPLPYSHGEIPYVYLADIEVPDQIRGMSFFQQLYPLQHQVNAIASLIYKAFVLTAHPKILAVENSVEINQLLNESTVIFHPAGQQPSLMVQPSVSTELFSYMNILESLLEKMSGIFTMSRGEAPSGVRAAKALRVLEEQEDKRAYNTSVKYNEIALVENARKSLSTMATFADDSDGRLARIVGKEGEYRIRSFKAANLAKPYDIRIENTTALSKSSAARIEEITEMAQVRLPPDAAITRAQFLNMLDLTNDEQFKDIATRAARCAQAENEDMLSGIQIKGPTEDEDLIEHWRVHMQASQSRSYKEQLPDDRKKIHQKHTYDTEYLMYEKAFGIISPLGVSLKMPNANFAMQLQLLPTWPVYFKMPVAQPGVPPMGMGTVVPQPGAPQEQDLRANPQAGNPVNGTGSLGDPSQII